jgi:hypothetical protein
MAINYERLRAKALQQAAQIHATDKKRRPAQRPEPEPEPEAEESTTTTRDRVAKGMGKALLARIRGEKN